MRLWYLLVRPITRRATPIFFFLLFLFTFYSYQQLTADVEVMDEQVAKKYHQPYNKDRIYRPGSRKPFFRPAQEEGIIQPKKYENTDYRVYSTMLLDKQAIRVDANFTYDRIWPDGDHTWDDRIAAQLTYIPEAAKVEQMKPFKQQKLKTIVLWNWGNIKEGRQRLLDDQCPVSQCYLSRTKRLMDQADAVLFTTTIPTGLKKRRGQIWVYYALESPLYTRKSLSHAHGLVNWTATYRRDSVIVAPYEKYMPFRPGVTGQPQQRNYAAGKTKLVAWFVSNCGAKSNRGKLAKELSRYIKVDVIGRCGKNICRRGQNKCFDMLNKDYKFYLSFENSNCRDYITEKFYLNGLQHDILPIVFGTVREDYERAVPPGSFIHVDDFADMRELATYLKLLDQNDWMYNDYFKWKGTGKFINTFFFCRLCAMLWDETRDVWYDDLDDWWRGHGVCLKSGQQSWGEMGRHQFKVRGKN